MLATPGTLPTAPCKMAWSSYGALRLVRDTRVSCLAAAAPVGARVCVCVCVCWLVVRSTLYPRALISTCSTLQAYASGTRVLVVDASLQLLQSLEFDQAVNALAWCRSSGKVRAAGVVVAGVIAFGIGRI